MRVVSLASGSCGNCLFIETEQSKVLIDAGVSPNYIQKALTSLGTKLADINALILTHAHRDHAAYASELLALDIPCYLSEQTATILKLSGSKVKFIQAEQEVFFANLTFNSFALSHDCQQPLGFLIKNKKRTLVVATDLGTVTPVVLSALKQADLAVFEANHDLNLLHNSSYPWHLKKRIASSVGHLSNKMAGFALAAAASGKEQKVLLAHLSEVNNRPDLALATVKQILTRFQIDSIQLAVAPRLLTLHWVSDGDIPA